MLGLDGFQQINDMLGHAAGDLVLRAVAERLKPRSDGAVVARLSGDEFAIAFDGADGGEPSPSSPSGSRAHSKRRC